MKMTHVISNHIEREKHNSTGRCWIVKNHLLPFVVNVFRYFYFPVSVGHFFVSNKKSFMFFFLFILPNGKCNHNWYLALSSPRGFLLTFIFQNLSLFNSLSRSKWHLSNLQINLFANGICFLENCSFILNLFSF